MPAEESQYGCTANGRERSRPGWKNTMSCTNPKRGTFSHSLEPTQAIFQRGLMHPTLCQSLPRNKRASAVDQCPLLGTGSWLPLAVSSVAFAALHDALGVLTPICDERTAHVVL